MAFYCCLFMFFGTSMPKACGAFTGKRHPARRSEQRRICALATCGSGVGPITKVKKCGQGEAGCHFQLGLIGTGQMKGWPG